MASNGYGEITTLTNTAAEIVASGTNELVILTRVSIHNTDSAGRVVTFHRVPSAGAAGAGNIVGKESVAAGKSTPVLLSSMILSGGERLMALADTGSVVNLDVSYTRTDQAA